MDSDRWNKIDALYNSLLHLDPAERESELAAACVGDESLRLDVLSLLESADTADSFLEEPAISFGLAIMRLEGEKLGGQTVGRYTIIETLGHGGMGEVYLAQDPRLNRRVALKLLPASITDDRRRVLRFEQEARAASAISHPNVAHIYEISEAEGQHYLTMEYVKGQTLRVLLRQRTLEPAKAVEIVVQVAKALSAAHSAGVIHRDIKPENIMVGDDGYVKVLDFGLAKLIENTDYDRDLEASLLSSLHTEPELFMGTSHYMSPEQVRRQPVDRRTDLWSLGVVSCEAFTSHRPFLGQSFAEVIAAILEKGPEISKNEQANLSPALRKFLFKALQKRPDDRYQTAEEMLKDLQLLSYEKPEGPEFTNASAVGTSTQAAGIPRRSSTRARVESAITADIGRPITIAERLDTVGDEAPPTSIFSTKGRRLQFVMALLLVVSAGIYFAASRKHDPRLLSRDINLRFDRLNLSGNVDDITLSPDGKYIASVISEAGKESIHITELATTGNLTIVPASGKRYSGLSFSPDSNYVYYLENQVETGTLYRVSKLGSGQRKLLDNVNTAVTFSPDGKRMAFTRYDLLEKTPALVISQSDGTAETVLANRTRSDPNPFLVDLNGAGPAWSPDGKLLACPTLRVSNDVQEMNLEILDSATGTGSRLNKRPWYDISRMTWLADGSGLVVAAKESIDKPWQLMLLSYPDGGIRPVTRDPNNYNRISGNADSSLFVSINVEENSNLSVVTSGSDGKFSRLSVTQRKGVSEVARNPDDSLVFAISDGKQANLWIQDSTAKSVKQLTFESNNNYNPTTTSDQRYIVFVSTRLGGPNIWRADADGTHIKQLTTGVYEDMPSVTHDGKWVIYRTARGVRKVSIEGGDSMSLFDKTALFPSVSPDGQLLAYFTPQAADGRTWHLEVVDLHSLSVTKRFELEENGNPFNGLRWTPGRQGLSYVSTANGSANIWMQLLNGEPTKQLTYFQDAEIQSFDWSSSGDKIFCVRHVRTFVPVLVRIF